MICWVALLLLLISSNRTSDGPSTGLWKTAQVSERRLTTFHCIKKYLMWIAHDKAYFLWIKLPVLPMRSHRQLYTCCYIAATATVSSGSFPAVIQAPLRVQNGHSIVLYIILNGVSHTVNSLTRASPSLFHTKKGLVT